MVLSTPSLISPSFQGGPTIFHKGNFLKHTTFSKNLQIRLVQSNFQPNRQAKLNRVKHSKKERENGRGGGPTMCHKTLLPSKGSNACRNIPFQLLVSTSFFIFISQAVTSCYCLSLITDFFQKIASKLTSHTQFNSLRSQKRALLIPPILARDRPT